MPRVVITAEVEDTESWEAGFRSHTDLFREQGLADVYEYGIGDGSNVAVCVEVDDADAFLEVLESPENVDAMEADGVIRDTVQVFVIDQELEI